MNYRVKLDSEEAAVTFAKLPPNLRGHLSSELRRLAESPPTLSSTASFPHPLDGQLFYAEPIIADDVEHFFTVMFKYGGEEFILVQWIVHRQVGGTR